MNTDELRGHCLELIGQMSKQLQLVRDYSQTPGNAWLARNELQKVAQLMTELESSIDAIKRSEE